MSARLRIQGAAAFGVKLGVEEDDLVYHADYEVPGSTLEKIAAHTDEIVAELKTRREQVAAVWPQLQDLDAEQYEAFRDAKIEQISILQDALDTMEGAASVILPEMRRNGGTWGQAVQRLLAQPGYQRYAKRRPKGYSDEQWLSALYQARLLGYSHPLQQHRVAS